VEKERQGEIEKREGGGGRERETEGGREGGREIEDGGLHVGPGAGSWDEGEI
jgi:hypothetical protein